MTRDSLTRIVAPEQPKDKEEEPDKPFQIFLYSSQPFKILESTAAFTV